MNIVSIAVLTGFFGDLLLQFFTKYTNLGGSTGWGLISYFEHHGSGEALCIAAGMMGLFYILYLFFLPLDYTFLALYGIVLDLLFRKTNLFPSLKGYYAHLNYFWSAVWGAIPMMLPYFIFNLMHL